VKNVAMFGIGYVGCVSAACLSRDGHRVIGVDVDPDKVAELNAGCAPDLRARALGDRPRAGPRREPGRDGGRRGGRASFRGRADHRGHALGGGRLGLEPGGSERVVAAIGTALRGSDRPYTVVVRSTLLPGILEQRLAPLLAEASGREPGREIGLCNNPRIPAGELGDPRL